MSKGENMVERCARAMHARLKATGPHVIDNWGDLDPERPSLAMVDGVVDLEDLVRAVIEALIEEPASGETLAAVEEAARSVNRFRSEDHIKSVALDSLTIYRTILRRALSQPNEEGEGK